MISGRCRNRLDIKMFILISLIKVGWECRASWMRYNYSVRTSYFGDKAKRSIKYSKIFFQGIFMPFLILIDFIQF